ncbi:23S rRNA (pseudouridine(1915)-N(3))-methyltransferase RlmH [Hydrogenimonas thermophila]|uniref:23S rRNA (pseudouridine(1915)-N(3))-methyltransferase RlmH n=1 Tax=Hydrogenimonas thermophila TaxID=223786 RepID=UPI002936F076|nr:23S rRNA (pseudouridine(1915)-N(3))-methyltransferase RlmH [Hydrogenimonas thermophila]WOE71194.1 23S rRNA (pseudouridine(1915)-N(3))-methyltransferase RlmH [Hydrogenimonas thermophila]WOE73714.1 23S rRNA (pseudouridine(1915)-N(3))-methyltransferase RlmH [Hydrogenimonas thermophila]
MNINVVAIAKPEKDCYSEISEHFIKMSKRFAKVNAIDIFNSKVTKAQDSGKISAQKVYEELFSPWMQRGFTIALDPSAKEMESEDFSKLLSDKSEVTFFIGGAFGHSKEFLKQCDRVISLSQLTMSHKIAKLVLFEQIYRALTIQFNHPYHK